jgi:hypothetical protein
MREEKADRGSPLAVIVELEPWSMKAHTMPRHSSSSGVPFSEGPCQSREVLKVTVGASRVHLKASFISGYYAGHACVKRGS